jgi:hypothetical protein
MAKENPNTKPKAATALQKFEQLAKRLVAVPKREADKVKQRQSKSSRHLSRE